MLSGQMVAYSRVPRNNWPGTLCTCHDRSESSAKQSDGIKSLVKIAASRCAASPMRRDLLGSADELTLLLNACRLNALLAAEYSTG